MGGLANVHFRALGSGAPALWVLSFMCSLGVVRPVLSAGCGQVRQGKTRAAHFF